MLKGSCRRTFVAMFAFSVAIGGLVTTVSLAECEFLPQKESTAATPSAVRHSVTIGANFKIFPDSTKLPDNFSLAGFLFQKLGENSTLFVNETSKGKGIQFPQSGLEVSLPAPVTSVDFEVGAFNYPVEVEALDSQGNVVRKRTIPGNSAFAKGRLSAPEIATLIFKEGGKEGVVSEISVTLVTCP